uniref:Uncharacterized protein n=1 Tax=Rhizophora mucronata TaxID=61149 RepID=A0A2P2LJ71_RHIMU
MPMQIMIVSFSQLRELLQIMERSYIYLLFLNMFVLAYAKIWLGGGHLQLGVNMSFQRFSFQLASRISDLSLTRSLKRDFCIFSLEYAN